MYLDMIKDVFEVLIVPVLGVVATYLITLINAEKEERLQKANAEKTKFYIEILNNTIVDCIRATNQTYVETLKKNGTFDAQAQEEALNRTYEAVMSILTNDAKVFLDNAIVDLSSYITNKIEAEIKCQK